LLVPLHLVAFAGLYLGTARLLGLAYSEAGVESAGQRLVSEWLEIPFLVPQLQPERSPHLFAHTLAAHRSIDLRLFDAAARPIGVGALPPQAGLPDVADFLAGRSTRQVRVERLGSREVAHGLVRLTASGACTSCHADGQVMGAAAMRFDFTEPLAAMRGRLRNRLALLLLVWGALLGASASLVRRTVERSVSRLRADLDAAAAGRAAGDEAAPFVLDPVSAEVHRSLRDFLARQRRREAEVASRLEHHDQLAHLGELAAGLAHEIKNPLAGIQGALEVLRDDARDDAERVRLYEEMLGELRRVNTILQRLLESGRPAPLRLIDVDPALLVRETVELLQPALRRRGVRLEAEAAEGLPGVRLDPAKMRQVLVNLIHNAAEAMRDGGRVTVKASRYPQGGGVVLAVADEGPGIAAEDMERVFQPFYTTKFTGTGLGLAISKSLVELHGGRIEVDSRPGVGTTMYVFLPGAAPSGAPDGAAEAADSAAAARPSEPAAAERG
jgi:signal transduction histidine kinase